mgnify:CR=1 FL=1
MRMDTLICRVDPKTGQWQSLQIPYAYPELETSTGLLTVQAMAEDRCIYIAPRGWVYAECLLPDALLACRATLPRGRATVQFIDPVLRESHHMWLNDVEIFEENGRPIFIDPETGYTVAVFAHTTEIFIKHRLGQVEHRIFDTSVSEI